MKYSTALIALVVAVSSGVHGFVPSSSVRKNVGVVIPRQSSSSSSSSSSTSLKFQLNRETGKSQLDPAVVSRYSDLPFPSDKVLAEYVWVDAVGNLRSKTRTLPVDRVSYKYICSTYVKSNRVSIPFFIVGEEKKTFKK